MAGEDRVDERAGSEADEKDGEGVVHVLVRAVLANELIDYFLG